MQIQQVPATSEGACWQACTSNNLVNGLFVSIEFILSQNTCYCKTNAVGGFSLLQSTPGFVASLIGNCATYNASGSLACQSVSYSTGSCVTTAGTPCSQM